MFLQSLSGHTTPIECVRFGHTEELVCAGSASGALKIWDLEAARLVRTLTGHKAGIRCIDFHPYGDFLSSGSGDTNLKLWDIRRKGCIFTYKGHSETVTCLKFSPDGQWVASGGEEGAVKVSKGQGKASFHYLFIGHCRQKTLHYYLYKYRGAAVSIKLQGIFQGFLKIV